LRSRWPVQSIWAANHESGPSPRPVAEDVLILRPEFDPRPIVLPSGGALFLGGLLQGRTLGESLDLAEGALDLPAMLAILISGQAIVGVFR
jgi:hypothetical protein